MNNQTHNDKESKVGGVWVAIILLIIIIACQDAESLEYGLFTFVLPLLEGAICIGVPILMITQIGDGKRGGWIPAVVTFFISIKLWTVAREYFKSTESGIEDMTRNSYKMSALLAGCFLISYVVFELCRKE